MKSCEFRSDATAGSDEITFQCGTQPPSPMPRQLGTKTRSSLRTTLPHQNPKEA